MTDTANLKAGIQALHEVFKRANEMQRENDKEGRWDEYASLFLATLDMTTEVMVILDRCFSRSAAMEALTSQMEMYGEELEGEEPRLDDPLGFEDWAYENLERALKAALPNRGPVKFVE